MVLFNYSTKELTAKIVYYGPGLCGKTTNLQFIHQNLPDTVRGKMLSLATKTDRTLFFDFLPIDLGEIRGMKTRVQLYTVPGQVFYNETRKLVLKGADGIVFVADSQKQMLRANTESFKNLEENLKGHGMNLAEMPHVIQFNKRDLPKLASIEEMNTEVNKFNAPFYESVATTGIGIQDTLKGITKLVLLHLTNKYESKPTRASQGQRPRATAVTSQIPAQPQVVPSVPAASPTAVPVSAAPPASPGVPASAPVAPAVVAAATVEPAVVFDDADIDDLVNDVGEAIDEMPAAAEAAQVKQPVAETSATGPKLEVDRAADPEWDRAPASSQTVQITAPAVTDTVRLTEVVDDQQLFEDPDLAVATMSKGEEREIVVPVEVRGEGAAVQRYALSIRLRLDPVE